MRYVTSRQLLTQSEVNFDANFASLGACRQNDVEGLIGEILHDRKLLRSVRSCGTLWGRVDTVGDHRCHVWNALILVTVLKAHIHNVIRVLEVEPGRFGLSISELKGCTIVKVKASRGLTSRARIYLKTDVVLHAGNEGDAVVVEQNWQNRAASDEYSLLKI